MPQVLNMLHNCTFHCLPSAVEEMTVTGTGCLLRDHCWYPMEVRNLTIMPDVVPSGVASHQKQQVPMGQYYYYMGSVVLVK